MDKMSLWLDTWATLALLVLLVPVFGVFSHMIRRRRFWCAQAKREVEVLVEERGLPGFAHAASVTSCSVFDPPTALTCDRRCVSAEFRRRWPSALPIMKSGGR